MRIEVNSISRSMPRTVRSMTGTEEKPMDSAARGRASRKLFHCPSEGTAELTSITALRTQARFIRLQTR